MNTLTPEQREMLRKVNLAQIHGLHSLAKWLLKEYLLAWPDAPRPTSTPSTAKHHEQRRRD